MNLRFSKEDADSLLFQLGSHGCFVNIYGEPRCALCRDDKDNYLLELADVSRADYLITGDKDLLVIEEYKGCKIIKPSDFLSVCG